MPKKADAPPLPGVIKAPPLPRAKKKKKAPAPPPAPEPTTALEPSTHPLAIIERVAKDPQVDVSKLERLIEMQKDIQRVTAKQQFDAAFAQMQPELPAIDKRGVVKGKGDAVRSRYARLGEDIQPAIKPVLQRFGFAIRFRTEWPETDLVRVIGILSHAGGHAETSTFEAPADKSEYRTHIQSLGSSVSYGRRYTTIDLLNLTVKGVDDDGQRGAQPRGTPPAPSPRTHAHPPSQPDEVITERQRQRFATLLLNSGRDAHQVQEWLDRRYKIRHSKDILRRDYDNICYAIEAEGDLPEVQQPELLEAEDEE